MKHLQVSPAPLLVCVIAILHFSISGALGKERLRSNLVEDTLEPAVRMLEVANKKAERGSGTQVGDEAYLRMAEILVGAWRGEVTEPEGVFRSYMMRLEFRRKPKTVHSLRVLEGRVEYSRYECKGAMVQLDPVSASGDNFFVFQEKIVLGGHSRTNPDGCDDGVVYIKIVDQDTLKWQWGWNPKGKPSAWATLFRVN